MQKAIDPNRGWNEDHCARANEKFTYAGSDILGEVGWYDGNSGDETHPVGLKKPNGFGLYDMSGNVYEWVWDWYGSYSSESQMTYLDLLDSLLVHVVVVDGAALLVIRGCLFEMVSVPLGVAIFLDFAS